MGTPDENRALVARFIEALDSGDVATAAACFDGERYWSHTYEADLAGTWEQQKANRRAGIWSDIEVERLALLADGDRVVHHTRFTATHTGTAWGIPASGRRITLESLESWRIEDGLIVEHWGGFHVTDKVLDRLQGEPT